MGINWKSPPADKEKNWISKSIEIEILLACNWNCMACFTGDSKILMAKSEKKKISDVKVGDEVISFDEKTSTFVTKKVINTMVSTVDEIYKIDSTSWRPTYATADHPLLIKGKGWVKVSELVPGDVVLHLSNSEHRRLNNAMKNPEVAKKMGAARTGKTLNMTKKGSEKISKLATKRMIENNPMKDPAVAAKGFLARKDRGKVYPSEKMTMEATKGLGLKFIGSGELQVGYKFPDFIIEGTNKLVEVWSSSVTAVAGRDNAWRNKRRRLFEKEGYEVLFLPVKCQLRNKKNIAKEKERIRKAVSDYKRNGYTIKKVTKITRESNPKAWTRLAHKLASQVKVYNLEVEDTHTYVVHGMIVHNCDVFSNLPSISWVRKATMSLTQIEKFCQEMKNTNTYIGRVRLLGGEPTLHPRLVEISSMMSDLVSEGHLGQVEIITNGSHPEKIVPARNYIDKIRVSGEKDKQKHHTANLAATPHSLGYEGKMCNAPWHCGISLNYYGYFPCSSGAGLARLMNDMERWQRLSLPQRPVLEEWPDLQDLCNYCYHGLRDEDKVKCGTSNYKLNVPNQEMWGHLAPWLHGKQPDSWKVYGNTNE